MILGFILCFSLGFLFGFYSAARSAKKRFECSMVDLKKLYNSAISPDRG